MMAKTDMAPTGPDLSRGLSPLDIPEQGFVAGHVGGEAVLLSRIDGEFHAVSGSCTHYGAPLSEGLVVGETVRCPWHHACFSLRTGAAIKAPAFDALQRWQVESQGEQVFVRTKLEREDSKRGTVASHPGKIVIVGGGAAGFAAAEMLRRRGFAGRLTILSEDDSPPCDRPNLSKDYLAGTAPEDWIPLKPPAFYQASDIDLRLDTPVSRIDVRSKQAIAENGMAYDFDALLLATGAEPIRLDTPGFDLPTVHTLRSLEDARRIIAGTRGAATAAIIGASFIGLEAAASLRARGLEVHVVAPEDVPMSKVLGPEIGAFVRSLHEANGVQFHLGHTAQAYDGRQLVLDDGDVILADLVVVGVGVRPRTALAARSGIAVDNGVLVDEYLETSVPGIFAAGDLANHPRPGSGERLRIEHWVVAERQGQTAAANMLGGRERYDDVPFFWSRHYEASIHYLGHAASWDETIVAGSVAAGDCTVRFCDGGSTRAFASIGRPFETMVEAARMAMGSAAASCPHVGCRPVAPVVRGH